MASPSSTAAYLMYTSEWDNEAEDYLRHVIKDGPGRGTGAVPSAFPSTYFEYSWVMSTLLKSGLPLPIMTSATLEKLATILQVALEKNKGTLGFAPSVGADADDTAVTILLLNLLGKPTSSKAMVETFESKSHFITYPGERDPSFTANCNVLLALLASPETSEHVPQIEKAARFLYTYWFESNDQIKDKWNTSPVYPTMLMAQAFVKLLRSWDQGYLPGIDEELVRGGLPLVLFQALSRTLQSQRPNGFWGQNDSFEETAYSVITIGVLSSLPVVRPIDSEIETAVHRGRAALESFKGAESSPDYLWIEKIAYSSPVLQEAYLVAALNPTIQKHRHSWNSQSLGGSIDMNKIAKFLPFYEKLPTIGALPLWRIQISLMEGCLFSPLLENVRFEVFPARSKGDKEEMYWDNIRFTWCCANSIDLTFASAEFILNWMKISYLNYQADEYMEAVIATRFYHDWEAVKDVIEDVFKPTSPGLPTNGHAQISTNGHSQASTNGHGHVETVKGGSKFANGKKRKAESIDSSTQDEKDLQEIRRVLTLLNDWTFTHPRVIQASPYQLQETKYEMKLWILGHLIQAENSHRLAHQNTYLPFETPTSNFYHWESHVSADHTSCPYAYELALCMLSDGQDTFRTPEQKYYSASCNRHLSTLCGMEKNYGSVPRDRQERNLNAVDFPEFFAAGCDTSGKDQKAQLLRLAQYEREAYKDALAHLETSVAADAKTVGKMQVLRVMTNVADSWGQMHVCKDLGRSLETITEANDQQLSGQWRPPPQDAYETAVVDKASVTVN